MSKRDQAGVPFDAETQVEDELWNALGDLPKAEPSENLRRRFYTGLETKNVSVWVKVREWLGLAGPTGWITATACILVGLAVGRSLEQTVVSDDERLAILEQQLFQLNRSLVLDKLESDAPNQRLQGVLSAVALVEDDADIASALLTRATQDRVSSVRTAAIEALAPRVTEAGIGSELMSALRSAESPLVQLALVDLILRYGSVEQVETLLEIVDQGLLHEDLINHVQNSVRRNPV